MADRFDAAGRAIARLLEEIASGGRPASRFATQKGSMYVQLPDGTTLRHKARRPEHGGDFGWMARSQSTAFITPEDANKLSLVQAYSDPPFSLVRDIESPRLAVIMQGDPRIIRGTVVPYATDPQSGLLPLEMWPRNSHHFGNPITAVEQEPNWSDWVERSMRGMPPPNWSW